MNTLQTMPKWRVWLHATRPPTLTAAIVPVAVGSAAAAAVGAFHFGVFVAALLSALCIQIGTNFSNDLFDFQKGADTSERLGPVRVTHARLLSEKEVAYGTAAAFGLAVLFGLYLIALRGWPVLLIGAVSIAFGMLYTGGWAFGYRGLGDLFTFVFFGPVAVVGTFYVHTTVTNRVAWIASVPVACLVTAIIVVNNLRDIDTDKKAGKKTLAVRIGPTATRLQYSALVIVTYVMPALLRVDGVTYFWLPWLSVPFGVLLIRSIWTDTGRALNRSLKLTGVLHLLNGVILAVTLLT